MFEHYKDFTVQIEYCHSPELYTGIVVEPASASIFVSASTLDELLIGFREAVDDYLEACQNVVVPIAAVG